MLKNFNSSQQLIEGKKAGEMKPENMKSDLIVTGSNKRSRNSSQEEKTRLTWSKINGSSNSGVLPFSNASDNHSTDDWTSSTDYSPSNRSYTISSTSGSIENEKQSYPDTMKNQDSRKIKPGLSNGESPAIDNSVNHRNASFENIGTTNNSFNQAGIDNSNNLMADCSNISDYVENALLISSTLTPDQGKSSQNGNNEQALMNSFQSSSTLNHDTERALDFARTETPVAGLKPDIVTLDFVKSAAQTFKSTSNNDDADSYSSLTSSFMSSVDSQDGSSIDSDIVENLYSKIAAATAKHRLKLESELNENKLNPQINPSNSSQSIETPSIKTCSTCNGELSQPGENKDNDENEGICCCDTSVDVVAELDFSNSNLKSVPDEIYQHTSTLTSLSLESNAITVLPKDLFNCQNLQELLVADNDIALLPPSLAGLTKLRHFDISKNVIEDIPECMPCLKNLVGLDASVNPIEKLSESFTQLMNLQELYMNDCFFDYLPASFGRMSELRVLELRDNQLQILPKSIRRLLNLSRLDLGGNVLQDWPDVISKLTGLKELWLDCNELNEVSNAIGELTQLVYLDLSRNFLQLIPNQISSLLKLTDLLLAENSLTSLPDSIGFLHDLTVINLENNQLEELPDSFGKLASLEEVDISHNKLTSLPSSVGKLKKLRMLLLDDNQLQVIPEELGQCIMMSILQLSRNQIESLPESLGSLTNLRVLNITQNRIPFLPVTLQNLTQLEALWISPNQSKPSVPVYVEVDSTTGCQILTNILFPQEENGVSRASKVLGSINSRDSQDYAIDAADDDDLEKYSKKERGTTHVFFDLNATTYSDVWEASLRESLAQENEESFQTKEKLLVNIDKNDVVARTDSSAPEVEVNSRIKRQDAVNDYAIVIPKLHQDTGLSVSFEEKPLSVSPLHINFSPDPESFSHSVPKESLLGPTEMKSRDFDSSKVLQLSSSKNERLCEKASDQDKPQTTEDQMCEKLELDNNAISRVDRNVSLSSQENLKPKIPQKPVNLRTKECHASTDFNLAKLPVDQTDSFAVSIVADSCTEIMEPTESSDKLFEKSLPMKNEAFEVQNESNEAEIKESTFLPRVVDSIGEVKNKLDLSRFEFIDNDENASLPTGDDAAENIQTSPVPFIMEDKPSSVSSGESIPATDDSGVGFIDAESHEDNEMDVIVTSQQAALKITWKSTSATLPAEADVMSKNQPLPVDSGSSENRTSSRPRKPPVPPPPISKKNRVSINIKKFEKQSESTPATVSDINSAPIPKQESPFKSPKKSSPTPVSKPMAIATILPKVEKDFSPVEEVPNKKETIEPYSPNDPNVSDVLKSLDLYTKATEAKKPSHGSDLQFQNKLSDENAQNGSQNEAASPRTKPAHLRKSKFDEALAATKHKHFREKLEKAMQLQQHQSSLTNSIKRLSRGSTSSISSIPRITSPVPHQHAYFDSMTADHTTNAPTEDATTSGIVHLKLKENLQPPYSSNHINQPTAHKTTRKDSPQQNAQRALSKAQKISQKPQNLSLEEQLGQLCLDGSAGSPPHTERGFVPYLPDEYCQSTSLRNSKKSPSKEKYNSISEPQRRPSKPEDWKHQLLEYLERKKSVHAFPSDKSASYGNITRRDIPRHPQTIQDYEPIRPVTKDPHRSAANSDNLARIGHVANSKVGGSSRATMSASNISHSSSKLPGRRSAGKYLRTRTPGPEMDSSNPKVDLAVRPKSAMDRPLRTSDPFDPFPEQPLPPKPDYMKKSHSYASGAPPVVPPTYQDHILRHVGSGAGNKDDHQNYVNLDYFHNRLRSSMREKRHENRNNQQIPTTYVSNSNLKREVPTKQSHVHGVEKTHMPIRQPKHQEGANRITKADHQYNNENPSQQVMLEHQHYQRLHHPFHAGEQHYANPAFVPHPKHSFMAYPNQQYSQFYGENVPHPGINASSQFRKPPMTDRNLRSERLVRDSQTIYDDPYRIHARYPDNPRNYNQPSMTGLDLGPAYQEQPYHVQPSMNDTSVSSAFRPYQQQQLIRPRQGQLYNKPPSNKYYANQYEDPPTYAQPTHHDQHHYQPSMDLLDGYQHQNMKYQQPNEGYYQRQNIYPDNMKPYMSEFEPSQSEDHSINDDAGMGVEVFAVTVKKNPNFGFHIMGGVDSGGNPYRPDDDGVFITYVAPGGAADGLVQPGDKILMVNGSEFIGINHKRAVDLLRNAGLAAKLVVERLVGRPV